MKRKTAAKRSKKSVGQRLANAVSFCVDCFSDLGKTKKTKKSGKKKSARKRRA